jgi:hypothetical protein
MEYQMETSGNVAERDIAVGKNGIDFSFERYSSSDSNATIDLLCRSIRFEPPQFSPDPPC